MDYNIMPSEAEKAKEFWGGVDVNFVFDALCKRLQYLRERIKAQRASDRDFVVGMNIILASELYVSPKSETDSGEEGLLFSDILPVAIPEEESMVWQEVQDELYQDNSRRDVRTAPSLSSGDELSLSPSPRLLERAEPLASLSPSHPEPQTLSSDLAEKQAPPLLPPAQSERASPIAPLSFLQPPFQLHSCSWACLPRPPPLSANHKLRGSNPLEVPLLWGFQRQEATPVREEAEPNGVAVFYKAPCGRSLRAPEEVMRYLRETEGEARLHLGLFSFCGAVRLHQASPAGGTGPLLEADLSRGAEPVPVQLCNSVDEARPERFRYRSHRWPRLPSPGSAYVTCCDCADGCVDRRKCGCLQLSLKHTPDAQLYRHRRLSRPVQSGLYECGPWCGCSPDRCQNRVVQLGLQVRLQVFRTEERGWGVRCLDDMDEGTFVCTYAGVVLRAGLDSSASSCVGPANSGSSNHKRKREEREEQRAEQSSDDEVEVVEEWRVPSNPDPPNPDPPNPSPSTSPLVHVSVIKMPVGPLAAMESIRAERECGTAERRASDRTESCSLSLQAHTHTDTVNKKWEEKEVESGVNMEWAWPGEGGDGEEEHLYYLDATEEGNVGRFLNHSCSPNLFVQNVFIDSHHRDFPTVAFFSSRVVTAGTELTWNYSYDPGSVPEQEVPCQCGCKECQGVLI
ncbi:hypothetical protein GJAV_G00259680 [Gymnothorax javanicus]|nr:hypothetical protein GJAV_G00259680 [Gymnothorax javanicus]